MNTTGVWSNAATSQLHALSEALLDFHHEQDLHSWFSDQLR
ncbi:DUF4351 domain-containing protein [Rhabdochromatium marinum]|nr:hypothetical protein [Rhabdochromatium marinum]